MFFRCFNLKNSGNKRSGSQLAQEDSALGFSKTQCTFAPEKSCGPGQIVRERGRLSQKLLLGFLVGSLLPSLQQTAAENTGKECSKVPLSVAEPQLSCAVKP